MTDLKQKAYDAIDEIATDLDKISKDIWENPEENFEEVKAHANITAFLEEKGFQVERNYITKTGFRSTFGENSDGPHIVVICEYDALPLIGHACGHNLIAEVGLASGIGIRAALGNSEKPLGKLTILGTPAEEGGGGKIDMIKAGVFKDVDIAMMAHPSPFNLAAFHSLAIEQVTVKYHGQSAHASAFPWNGVNALDAAVLCYQNVSCLRQQFKPTWRVHGVIKNGGSKPNIIPDLTELEFYARTPTKSELTVLMEKVDKCFESAAAATGCTVEISWSGRPYYDMKNNKTMSDLYYKNGTQLGIDFDKHGVAHFDGNAPTGSTDMGNVSYETPSIHPMFYIGTDAVNHTKGFTAASGDQVAQKYTIAVAKAIAATAIDILQDPKLLARIKEEYRNGK
ncbi:peptidase M20 domain-containing protein 2-like [Ruditapes philippinarum]|uniref:peptidase M20 domain-containing protein 2-like n=1 Tax=Ruditapes philippinarum TaxID=129788 RepID=UPI00295ACFA9|nr:peptidase M20 domain-containing protein 2-like [Ruditapes philippinarum]